MVNPTWIKVQPTWNSDRVRKEASRLILDYKMAIWLALKDQPEVLQNLQEVLCGQFVKELKVQGVKTPIELVKYLADLTVNLLGGAVSITGDSKEASIAFDHLPGWDQIKGNLELDSTEEREKLLLAFRNSMDRFCNLLDLRFTAEVEADFDSPVAKLTFRQ